MVSGNRNVFQPDITVCCTTNTVVAVMQGICLPAAFLLLSVVQQEYRINAIHRMVRSKTHDHISAIAAIILIGCHLDKLRTIGKIRTVRAVIVADIASAFLQIELAMIT